MLLPYALGRTLAHDQHTDVWERLAAGGGMEFGTIAAFLVLEEKHHALDRGAEPIARLASVESDQVRRTPGAITAALERMWSHIAAKVKPENAAILSGASGIATATEEERQFLTRHPDLAVRATGSHLGHALEPQFPANVVLAAAAVHRGKLYPPRDASGMERPMDAPLRQAIVTSVGHWRTECLALVEAVR
jgi:3-oxoacyl-[acyl-carrier-protein] synthase II